MCLGGLGSSMRELWGVDGEHVGVYILKNHQVVYLRFVQISLGKLCLYIKKKKNEISIEIPKAKIKKKLKKVSGL